MRPARPSTRKTVKHSTVSRKSVVMSQRSGGRHISRPQKSRSVLKVLFTCCLTLLSLCVGTWLLVTVVILPYLTFPQQDAQVLIFLPKQDTTQGWLLRLQPSWKDSEVLHLTDLDSTQVMSEKFLSQQLGLLVHDVVQVDAEIDTAVVQLPAQSTWQRILNTRSKELQRTEQLRMVVQELVGTPRSVSRSEFRSNPVIPVVDPVLGAGCPVAVMNTTKVVGLAEEVSSVLERSGVLVVRTASGRETAPTTKLRILPTSIPNECLTVVDQLQNAFGLEVQETGEGSQIDFEQYRAEILLELGSDW